MDPSKIPELFKGLFISSLSGQFYVKVLFDTTINAELLSAFIAGLSMFGKEAAGHIDEISIKGLDLEIFVVVKHEIILTAIFSKTMPKKDIREEAESLLDKFHELYGNKLSDSLGCVDEFCEFEATIKKHIENYFQGLEPEKKGFWSKFRFF
jgi:predicted regulator of Ras-like GTPase activity (Roadblock/LC7/MglB family)